MKREIKFRGKQIDDGRWVKGGIWYFDGRPERIDEAKIFVLSPDGKGVYRVTGIDVDSDTVGQYTGLKDKNGVEIYEGDMLKTVFEKPIQVYWNNEMSCFYPLVSLRPESVEVIGNIYENPELL